MVKKAKEYGMAATALVDSGTIAGFKEFTKSCNKYDVKPIYGCGFYLAKGSRRAPEGRSHLVLLVYNEKGMINLTKLDEHAQKEGMYEGKAHIDDELLKIYHEGLICLTGGLGGDIDKHIIDWDLDSAIKRASFYKSIYGDNFYLELQDHGNEKNIRALEGLYTINQETAIQMLVSQGAFYLNDEDADKCNNLRKKYGNKTLCGHEYHFKSPEEMNTLFKGYPKALANTERIAEQCLQYKGL